MDRKDTARSVLLSTESMTSGYGKIEVLHALSLSVSQGEIVSIIGANGAGKTSLLKCLSGIHSIWSGSVYLDGREITNMPAQHRVGEGIALVPEGRWIFSRLTVRENLQLGGYLRRDKAAMEKDLERVFSLFPILAERQRQAGGTLSGGEQQMLAIGRALMSAPRVLLMDEPSMGVAPLIIARIFETIVELNASGLTILLVEQNAKQALKVAHRAYVLEVGRVTMTGTGAELLKDPRVASAYLGA